MQINNKRSLGEIESSLGKMEGRHLRLLNRIATKRLKDKITTPDSKENVNKQLKKSFHLEEAPLYSGVVSAIYSKLNGDIKGTLYSGANLGLVIENNDVKINYDLIKLGDFMNFAGTYDSEIFKKGRFFRRKIKQSNILKYSFNKNSSIAKGAINTDSSIANYSTNIHSSIAEDSTNTNSPIAKGSTNTDSSIAKGSTNTNSPIAESSTNTNSPIAENSTNFDSFIAKGATNTNSPIAENSTNLDSFIAKGSTNTNSPIAYSSTNVNSSIANYSTNTNSPIAENSTNTNSRIALGSTNTNSSIAKGSKNTDSVLGRLSEFKECSSLCLEAKVRNCEIGKGAKKDSSSSIGKGIKYI